MSEREPKELIMFYAETSARVRHLETTRHGLIAMQLVASGYFLKEALGWKAAELWSDDVHCVFWIVLTSLMLVVLSFISHNLFIKILLCAKQLMQTEYALALAPRRLGYYSFGSTGQSFGFNLFGMIPSLINAGYAAGMCVLAAKNHAASCAVLAALFMLLSLAACGHVHHLIRRAVKEKNAEEIRLCRAAGIEPWKSLDAGAK